jgi:hypothetical protein
MGGHWSGNFTVQVTHLVTANVLTEKYRVRHDIPLIEYASHVAILAFIGCEKPRSAGGHAALDQ